MTGHAITSPTISWLTRTAWQLGAWFDTFLSARADAPSRARAAPDAAALARFQTLILPHLEAAHNLARFLCRDADAAEDIVQEAFLRAFRSFADYRGGSPRAWILAIVRNCHHSWWQERRKSARLEPIESGSTEDGETMERTDMPHDGADPESALLQRAEAEEVRDILGTLPEAFREILVLRELEDLSYREISDVTTTPLGTVMSRLARARALFAEAWNRRQDTGKDTGKGAS